MNSRGVFWLCAIAVWWLGSAAHAQSGGDAGTPIEGGTSQPADAGVEDTADSAAAELRDGGGAADGGTADGAGDPSGDSGEPVAAESPDAPPAVGSEAAPQEDFDPFAEAEADLAGGEAAEAAAPEGEAEVIVPDDSLFQIEGIDVRASGREEIRTVGGAVSRIDEEQLETFKYDDPNQVLSQVPGLYIRSEDGYGLRPNIGLRGSSSDRSKKVTLLEDGILFAPAPYTASAAYYFPLMSHVTSVEVIKGPGALVGGPHSVGGTIDLRTRAVPDEGWIASVEGSGGSYRYGNLHGYVGYGAAQWGLLGEVSHLQTTGYKNLDGGGNTGFSKQEGRFKFRVNSRASAQVYQRLDVKLGYAHEQSYETYLGLSDDDFRDTPLRRYAASQRDDMTWWRTQGVARYSLGVANFDAALTLYRHDFDRLWERFDTLDGQNVFDILRNPGSASNRLIIDVLSGEADSITLGAGRIAVANNQRRFVSQGADLRLTGGFGTGPLEHEVTGGARLHYDEIVRDHTEDGYFMQSGQLVPDGTDRSSTNDSTASTTALALFLLDEIQFHKLTLSPGVRAEIIFNQADNRLTDENFDATQHAVLGGAGAHYALTDTLGVVAGVHQGFSPAPVAVDGAQADPERATSYEGGARYLDGSDLIEAIAFFNDYQNLLGTGTTGLVTAFNSGSARIWGIELSTQYAFQLPARLTLPLNASYTYQSGEYRSEFNSGDPSIGGGVEVGDELTYLPPHQLWLSGGLRYGDDRAGLTLGVKFVDAMRERPGKGEPAANERTDRYTQLDLAMYGRVIETVKIFAKLDNLTNVRPLAARLPLGGARPIKPLTVQVGAQWEL